MTLGTQAIGRRVARRPITVPRTAVLAAILTTAALVLAVVGLAASGMVGTRDVPLTEVVEIAYRRAWGLQHVAERDLIVSELRLPRGALAFVVGASLALVGCVLQALVRNPLADSSVLGGTAGAGLGAVLAIVLAPGAALVVALPLGAFAGAGAGFATTVLIASVGHSSFSPLKLVLAGVATGFVLGALTQFVIVGAGDDRKLRSALFWQLGSVADARWTDLGLPAAVLLACTIHLLLRARRLDALAFGDLTARSLGVDPRALRIELITVSALVVGTSVAVAGGIGFVSLVVPHVCRLVVGSGHRRLLPVAAALGGAFLIWADVLARIVAPPAELPLGVVTALVGGVAFAVLLMTRMRDQ